MTSSSSTRRHEWRLGDGLLFDYSGRFNLRAANDLPFPSHENVLNELREAFVSWQPAESVWIDVGRINLKSGVAVGFNPTDFFRSRSVVLPLTVDPSVLREDRLGTLMVQGQYFWTGASLTAAFAPRVTLPTAIYRNNDLPNFDPMLDRTNAQDRFLLKGSMLIAEGFSPELLLYHAANRTQIGTNLTVAVGRQTVAYVEWAGGPDTSLIDNALSYGRETGTLPATSPAVIPVDQTLQFQNQAGGGVLVYHRIQDHLQSRISFLPAGIHATRLEQLVWRRNAWRCQSGDHFDAVVHPRLCA